MTFVEKQCLPRSRKGASAGAVLYRLLAGPRWAAWFDAPYSLASRPGIPGENRGAGFASSTTGQSLVGNLRPALPTARIARLVAVPEPYIPWLPYRWNRVLVLAEAQNLSTKNQAYVDFLMGLPREERFQRLGRRGPPTIGIQPWDDGSLPLAMAAVYPDLATTEFAVSNAVVWSLRTVAGTNANPNDELTAAAIAYWLEVLPILKPQQIVCAGAMARKVIEAAWKRPPLALRSPSPLSFSKIAGLFDTDDLLCRYKEVARALERYPEFGAAPYRRNTILFACHAVSVATGMERD